MSDSELKPDIPPQRLCSEIQLFDLCDLDSCNHKRGRFCTDLDMLDRFEKIADNELRTPERYLSEDSDDSEADDVDGYDDDEDDEFAMENAEDDDDDGWEDKE